MVRQRSHLLRKCADKLIEVVAKIVKSRIWRFPKWIVGDSISTRMLRNYLGTILIVSAAMGAILNYSIQKFNRLTHIRESYRETLLEFNKARFTESQLYLHKVSRKPADIMRASELMSFIHDAQKGMNEQAKTIEAMRAPEESVAKLHSQIKTYEKQVEANIKARKLTASALEQAKAFEIFLREQIDDENKKIEQAQMRLYQMVLITLALGLLFGSLIFRQLSRSITDPLFALSEAAKAIASGDWSVSIPTRAKGEVGALAKAMQTMLQALTETTVKKEHYQAIVNTAPSLIVILDRFGKIVLFNQTSEKVTGYSFEEVKGQYFWDLFLAEEERGPVCEIFRQIVADKNVKGSENYWVTKGKEKRLISWANTFINGKDGKPDYVVSIGIDITEKKAAENYLKQSLDALAQSQQIAKLGSFDQDMSTQKIWWSDELYTILGLKRRVFIPTLHTIKQIIHSEDLNNIREALITAKNQDAGADFQVRMKHAAGHFIHVRIRGQFRFEGEKPVQMVGTVQDITDWKKAQEDLARSEESLRLALAAGNMGTWDADWPLQPGKAKWSERMRKLFEFDSDQDLTQEMVVNRIHPDDRNHYNSILTKALSHDGQQEVTYRLLFPDGRIKWIYGVGQVIERDETHQPIRMAGICMDITERKEAEDRVRASEAILAESQRVAHLGSWTHDIPKKEIIWSDEAFRIRGLEPQSVKPTIELFLAHIHDEDRARAENRIFQALSSNVEYDDEFRIVTAGNDIRWIHSRGRTMTNESGKVIRFFGTEQDITDRKTAQQQIAEQQEMIVHSSHMASLGEMASGIGHEMNTPLADIRNNASLMIRKIDCNKIDPVNLKDHLNRIIATTEKTSEIVQSLRDLTRDVSDSPNQSFTLQQVFNQALSLCRHKFRKNGINLIIKDPLTPMEELVFLGKPTQISQVMINLLNNAFDAVMERPNDKERWISLEVRSDATCCEIAVTDSGPGISEENQKDLFQSFFTTKPVGKGTGLGLSISKKLIENHNGQLYFDRSSKHTRFVIHLPALKPASQAQAA